MSCIRIFLSLAFVATLVSACDPLPSEEGMRRLELDVLVPLESGWTMIVEDFDGIVSINVRDAQGNLVFSEN